jgi:hypothetical protein
MGLDVQLTFVASKLLRWSHCYSSPPLTLCTLAFCSAQFIVASLHTAIQAVVVLHPLASVVDAVDCVVCLLRTQPEYPGCTCLLFSGLYANLSACYPSLGHVWQRCCLPIHALLPSHGL